jgi:hypothetical protein
MARRVTETPFIENGNRVLQTGREAGDVLEVDTNLEKENCDDGH